MRTRPLDAGLFSGVGQAHLPVGIPQTAVVVSWQRGTRRLFHLARQSARSVKEILLLCVTDELDELVV
jgi:hypothetical protein